MGGRHFLLGTVLADLVDCLASCSKRYNSVYSRIAAFFLIPHACLGCQMATSSYSTPACNLISDLDSSVDEGSSAASSGSDTVYFGAPEWAKHWSSSTEHIVSAELKRWANTLEHKVPPPTKEQAASRIPLGVCFWPHEVPVLAVRPYDPDNPETSYEATTTRVTKEGKWSLTHYYNADVTCHLTDGAMNLLKASTKARLNEQGYFSMNVPVKIPNEWKKAVFEESEIVSCCKLPGSFDSYAVYLGRDNHGTVFPLPDNWFDHNRDDQVHRSTLDERAARSDFPWIRVRPGNRLGLRERKEPPLQDKSEAPLEPEFSNPKCRVVYRQFEGERNCYLTSFTSALHAFGMKQESRIIHSLGRSMPVMGQPNDFIHRIVEKHFHGSFQFKRCRNKKKRFDPLRSRCNYPTVVLLKRKGKASYPHCVAFYKNMIFDSSFSHVLKKNRKNLDYICGGEGQYLGVWWSKQLQPVDGSTP